MAESNSTSKKSADPLDLKSAIKDFLGDRLKGEDLLVHIKDLATGVFQDIKEAVQELATDSEKETRPSQVTTPHSPPPEEADDPSLLEALDKVAAIETQASQGIITRSESLRLKRLALGLRPRTDPKRHI